MAAHASAWAAMGARELQEAGPAAAVDYEGAAVGETAAVGGEEDGHSGHFVDRAVAALLHGDHLVELAFGEAEQPLEVGLHRCDQLGLDEARQDGVAPDPLGPELHRRRL